MYSLSLRWIATTHVALCFSEVGNTAGSSLLYYENFADINPGVEWINSNSGFFRELMPRINNFPLSESPDGGHAGALNDGSWAYHDLGLSYQPNTTYEVSLFSARRFSNYGVLEFGLFDGPPSRRNQLIAPALGPGVTQVQRDAVLHRNWSQRRLRYQFTTSSTAPDGTIVVLLRNTGSAGRAYVDGLRVTATLAIPEPSSLIIFCIAFLPLSLWRKRSCAMRESSGPAASNGRMY